jgi:transposase
VGARLRKRHVALDTLGNLLCVIVHSAGIQHRDGAMMVIAKLYHLFSFNKLIWADGGYAGKLVLWVYENLGWNLSIVKRSDKAKGFILLPRRWVVERFFAWLSFDRIPSKDYHHNPRSSESAVYASSAKLLLRRLAHA